MFDLSYTLRRGETLGIVGESGSGKSVSSLAVMGLLNLEPLADRAERHLRRPQSAPLPGSAMRDIRGKDIAMIFRIRSHASTRCIGWVTRSRRPSPLTPTSRTPAERRAVELLEAVGIPRAQERARDYPHQFSGGMRQRAMIAMALVHNPSVLIADEPTTALDVTVQAQILGLIERVKREFDMGVILITHDLGVIAETAETVLVMYAGRAMEHGPARRSSRHRSTPTPGVCFVDADHRSTSRELVPIEGSAPSLLNFRADARSIRGAPTSSRPARSSCPSCGRCRTATSTAVTSRPKEKRQDLVCSSRGAGLKVAQ